MKRIMIFLYLILLSGFTPTEAQVISAKEIEIRINGDIQIDSRNYFNSQVNSGNNFLLRRVRTDFRGSYKKIFEFRLMPNFAGSRLEIQDAYAAINLFSALVLRGGKFKTPLGLERIQSPTKGMFIELGLTSNLVPTRDIGFELSGVIADGLLNYSAGIYNGVVDGSSEDLDTDINKEFSGRLFLLPFIKDDQSFLKQLGFGAAFSSGKQSGTINNSRLNTYRTSGQTNLFSFRDSVISNGNRLRIIPQLYLYSGRLGFLAEYVINRQSVRRIASTAEISNSAWQTTISFLLTDDNSSFNGVKPKSPFNPAAKTWGAFEIAFRYNKLSIDKDAFPIFSNPGNSAKDADAWTLAFKWYLNDYFLIAVNYETTTFSSAGSNFSLKDERALFARLQAVF